jgi:RNA polymerase sigma-70 factor (ECF subfamily)
VDAEMPINTNHQASISPNGHLAAFQEYRTLLFSLAYRMLGSVTDAEDILQDAYMRFQSAPLAAIESPRAYLSTIVTRLCLNHLTSARTRREMYVGPWLPEPILGSDQPELTSPEAQATRNESVSMAFLVLLERLTPAERAVFLLREVFEYDYDEIAAMLEKSEGACRQLFSRAKEHITANRPRFQVGPEEHRRLLEQFLRAATNGDLHGLTDLLSADVTVWADGGGKARGAALQPVRGRSDVARFVIGVTAKLPVGAQYAVADVNGQPTLLVRHPDGMPAAVVSIEVDEGRIRNIWAIANPDKLGALRP